MKEDITFWTLLTHALPMPRGSAQRIYIDVLKEGGPMTRKQLRECDLSIDKTLDVRIKQFLEKGYIKEKDDRIFLSEHGKKFLIRAYEKNKKFSRWVDKNI